MGGEIRARLCDLDRSSCPLTLQYGEITVSCSAHSGRERAEISRARAKAALAEVRSWSGTVYPYSHLLTELYLVYGRPSRPTLAVIEGEVGSCTISLRGVPRKPLLQPPFRPPGQPGQS